jgi:uncharacterized membrane-anchored protein
MVENLNIQKVLAPISLTSRVKKAGKEKNKNRQRSFEEEFKEKKEKKEGLSVDKQKADEKTNVKIEESLKEKHDENTESMKGKQGKLIDLHI